MVHYLWVKKLICKIIWECLTLMNASLWPSVSLILMNWSLLIQLSFSGYKVEVSFVAICLIIILSIMIGLYRFYKGLIKYVCMMHENRVTCVPCVQIIVWESYQWKRSGWWDKKKKARWLFLTRAPRTVRKLNRQTFADFLSFISVDGTLVVDK